MVSDLTIGSATCVLSPVTPTSCFSSCLQLNPHPPEHFLFKIPEESELSQQECYGQQDQLITDQQHAQPEEQFPYPGGFIRKSYPSCNQPGEPCCGGTGNGKHT